MKSHHTIGPWRNIDGRIFSDYFISKTPIATIHKSDRRNADSALITAAPELLDALITLRSCIVNRNVVSGDFPYTEDVVSAMNKALDVIAKAEGR